MPSAEAGAKIPCPTPHALQIELDALATTLEPDEREDTWEKFEKALIRFAAITRGGGYKHLELYVRGVGNKGVGLRIVDCMLSDRGRLSGVSTDLLQTFAPRLASHFHPLVHLYLPPLIRLLARPNKVYLKRAEKCLHTIISHCHLSGILIHLRHGLEDKSDACKRSSALGVERAVLEWEHTIWGEKGLDTLELCIRKMATDRDADVRKTGKRVWEHFMEIWPERVDEFSNPLTPTIRRYLDIPQSDGGQIKAKPRAAAHPLQMALRSAASTHEPPAGPTSALSARTEAQAGPSRRPRLARAVSNTTDEDDRHPPTRAPLTGLGRATRTVSATLPLHKQTSASSLHDSQDAARHALLSKPARTLPPSSFRDDGPRRPAVPRARSHEPRRPHSADPEEQRPQYGDDLGSSQSSSSRRNRPPSPGRPYRIPSAANSSETVLPLASSSTAPASIPPPVGRVKARVSDFERMVGENTPPARPPLRSEVQAVAAIPLPPSPLVHPVVSDCPPSPKQLQRVTAQKIHSTPTESPSLSSLLRKNDVGEADMSLLDLSVANVSVAPSPAPRRQVSATSLSSTPRSVVPATVQQSTPVPMVTPQRRASLDNPGTTTPNPNTTTPTPKALRRISPLPRRSLLATPNEDSSPPKLGTKRKGSDPELSFPPEQRTAVQEKPSGPRYSQTLISFGDSPSRDASFVFGNLASATSYGKMGMRRESTLHDLMSLATPSAFDTLATPARPQPTPRPIQQELLVEDDEEIDHDPDVTVSLVRGTTVSATSICSATPGVAEDLLDMDETAILTAPPLELEPERRSPVACPPGPIASTEGWASAIDTDHGGTEYHTSRELSAPEEDGREIRQQPLSEAALSSEGSEPVKETQFDPPQSEQTPVTELDDEDAADGAEATVARREQPVLPNEPSATAPEPFEGLTLPLTLRTETGPPERGTSVLAEPEPPLSASVRKDSPPAPQKEKPELPKVPLQSRSTTVLADEPQPLRPSALAPRRPITAPVRPATRTVSHPVEKKSFRPVSKLLGEKGVPAPAKLATRSASTRDPEKRPGATLSASQKRSASAMTNGSASALSTVSRGTATAASTAGKAEGGSISTRSADSAEQTSAPHNRKPNAQKTRNTASTLFKPTAATAARAAAAPARTEQGVAKAPPSRPGTAMSNSSANGTRPTRPTTTTSSTTSSATTAPRTRGAAASGGLFASTAASRARTLEAALPPSKRQRVKLKAPMESFRPGRSANKSKASVLGTSSAGAAAKRPVRAVTRRDAAKAETFPLPGPGLSQSLSAAMKSEKIDKGSERSVRSSPADVAAAHQPSPLSKTSLASVDTSTSPMSAKSKSSSLAIPVLSSNPPRDDSPSRTPISTSPLAVTEHLTPSSTRTSRSRDSGNSPSSKIVPTLPKALDPVVTAVHGADVLHRTPSKRGGESPAVLHSRRISGIPPSLKKMLDAQKAERDSGGVPEGNGGVLEENDENLVVIRSDVSTPSGKSAAILARFSDRGAQEAS